jgi:hypothetical protein
VHEPSVTSAALPTSNPAAVQGQSPSFTWLVLLAVWLPPKRLAAYSGIVVPLHSAPLHFLFSPQATLGYTSDAAKDLSFQEVCPGLGLAAPIHFPCFTQPAAHCWDRFSAGRYDQNCGSGSTNRLVDWYRGRGVLRPRPCELPRHVLRAAEDAEQHLAPIIPHK